MTQEERLDYLLAGLARERPGLEPPGRYEEKRALLRALMNLRPPRPLDPAWLRVQDDFLQAEAREKGIVEGSDLPVSPLDPRLALWQGDITRLRVDAIVNAANAALLGCFCPNHGCIDNAIHSAAGLQLRQACRELMEAQGHEEPVGLAKLTPGFNLPARYVLHTVGPIVQGPLTPLHRRQLAGCYRCCLEAGAAAGLESIAFCCVSTGEFHFPNRQAAEIAVSTVRAALNGLPQLKRVIFNVYKDTDLFLYRALLRPAGSPAAGPDRR